MDELTEEQKKRMMEAGQAVMNLSHGIKNILQAVLAGQNVMDEALNRGNFDVAKRTWDLLKPNLGRIQKLALDMLKFSRDETLQLQPCQFNRLVESAVRILHPQAGQRQVSILTQCDEHLERVSIDPEQMQDVVVNLVLNAIEAVSPGKGQVVVRTILDRAAGQALLQVSDNGPGIEDVKIIFEPFYSTKSNVGTGLGLTIAQKIVRLHGGAIEVESLPGKGAVFTVRLPIAI